MHGRWKACWEAGYEVYVLLRESLTLGSAREKLINYLEALDWGYRRDLGEIQAWNYILLKESVRCMKNIISPRNERLAETSALKMLWAAARDGDADVEDDFIAEFEHLFKAIRGRADVYPPKYMKDIATPEYDQYQGREAAIKRSEFLDRMAGQMDEYIGRYPSGLSPDIVERRKETRRKVLEAVGGSEGDWNSWRWHFDHVFRNMNGLEIIKQVIELTPEEEEGIERAIENRVPFGVTPHYLHLMDPKPTDVDFAVRRQVFPPMDYVDRMTAHREDRSGLDFMREGDTTPVDLVTRRYPRVAIIKPYDSCPQICVYCQRNWEITSPFSADALASPEQIDTAIDWFAEHDYVVDVLLTGGDPLVMEDEQIKYILDRFAKIRHIRSIRIATRIPVTVPQRITEDLCRIFADYYEVGKHTLCMVTHFSHPYEVTPETAEAIKRVKMQGMHVYNQQVYSFANSRRFESGALRFAVKQIGIDPYYTFNMKGKAEIQEYAVPVARILQERKEEARLLSGIFRTDEPVFNVPFLGKNHLRAWQDHEIISILPDGRRVYSFHPWEKNLTKINPYLYTDVTVKGYLDKLEARGEDPEDYKSIWYYY